MLPEHRLASGLNLNETMSFVNGVIAMAEPVAIHYRWRATLRDPGDEMVLEAAVNGQSDSLVTFNRRHFEPVRAMFGIAVLAPGEALRRLKR